MVRGRQLRGTRASMARAGRHTDEVAELLSACEAHNHVKKSHTSNGSGRSFHCGSDLTMNAVRLLYWKYSS